MAYAISEQMRNRLNAAGSNSLAAYSNARDEEEKKKKKKNKGGLLGGLGYVGGQLLSGILGVGEGVYDFVVGGVADIFGAEEFSERLIKDDVTGDWQRTLTDWYNPSKGMQFVGDVVSGLGQTATYVGLNLIPGAGTALSTGAMVAGAGGRGVTAAYQKTGKLGNKEWLYGTGSGLVEAGLEKVTGGVGKISKAITKSAGKEVTQSVAKSAVRSGLLKNAFKTGAGEFVEEAASEIIDPYWQRLTGVDTEAETASLGEILRAGAVGFVSGAVGSGIGSGIGNARSVSTGSKILNENNAKIDVRVKEGRFKVGNRVASTGNVDSVLGNAKNLLSTIDSKEASDFVAGNLVNLKASYDAYNKLSNKTGIRGKMLLGEIAQNIAYTEVSQGVDASKIGILDNAEDIAQYLTNKKGVAVTVEDIKNNKDNILTDLAIADFSAKMIVSPEYASEMVSQGKMGVLKMQSQYEAWKNSLTQEQMAKASADLGVDLSTASYKDFNKAMGVLSQNQAIAQEEANARQMQANALTEQKKKEATPLPQSVSLAEGEKQVYRTQDGDFVGVTRTADGYTVAVESADGSTKQITSKAITENQVNTLISEINKNSSTERKSLQEQNKNVASQTTSEGQATTETVSETEGVAKEESKVKQIQAKAKTQALTEKARSIVKDFDALPANTKARIREMLDTAQAFKVSEENLKFISYFMVRRGVAVSFAEMDGNGVYDTVNGKRFIQLNGKNSAAAIRSAAIHEFAHDLRDNSEGYKLLSDLALKTLTEEDKKGIKDLYEAYYEEKGKELTEDILNDELTAYALEKSLNDEEFLKKHLNQNTEGFYQKAKGLASRLASWFKGKTVKGYQVYKALSNLYDAVLASPKLYTQNKELLSLPIDGKIVNSRSVTEEDVKTLLTNAQNKKYNDGSYIPIRINTPSILIDFAKDFGYDVKNSPLAMRVYKARQALSSVEDWDGKPTDTPHNLKPAEVVEIIKAMDNPSYLVYQTANNRFAEIVKFNMKKEKAYAIIDFSGIHKNEDVMNGYNGGEYNILVTVYPSESSQKLQSYLKNKKNVIKTGEEIKKKGLSQRGLGGKTPAHLNDLPFANSIYNNSENVNPLSENSSEKIKKVMERASLGSSVDSNGKKLTEEQRKFFKDSKVRDKDGNLLVVYHGTETGGFTIFSESHSGEAFWFADKTTAESYIDKSAMGEKHWSGKGVTSLYNVYLNAKNPLILDAEGYRGISMPTDIFETDGRKRFHHIDDIAIYAKDNGYDGLIVKNVKDYGLYTEENFGEAYDYNLPEGTVYAVFNTNQIKLTTNQNPTESEDIRFSLTYAPTGKTNIVMDNTLNRQERRMAQKKVAKKYTHRFQSLRVAFVNQQAAIEDALKDMGKSLEESEAIVQTARSASSKAQRAISGDIVDTSEMHTSGDATTLAKGVQKLMAPVKKAKLEAEFFDYLFNRHNIDRLKVDKPVNGNTAEESQAVIKRLEKQHPEMKKWGEEWDKMVGALLTLRVKEGIITQEQADYLRETYPHYVPTYREGGAKQGMTGGFKGKNDVMISKTLKKATGSTEALLRPDEVIARQIMETYRAIGGNYVANQLYESYLASGKNHPDIEIVSKEKVTKEDAENTDVIGNLEEGSQAAVNKTNGTVTFYRDGERITMRVSSNILAGFDGFYKTSSVYEQNIVARTLAKGMQLFKSAVTSWSPFFIVRNAIRDIQDSAFYTKNGMEFAKQIPNAWKGIATNSKEWQLYLSAGGLNSNVFGSEGFTGMVSERGFETIDVSSKQGIWKAVSFMRKQGMKIDTVNMIIEQIPRFAEFLASRKAGKTVDQALLDSADVTVNFGRSGSVTRIANRYFIPFINASVQGGSKTVRTIKESRRSIAAFGNLVLRGALIGIVPAILNNMMYDDDEDYQNLRTDVKENYYLFKTSDGKFLKFPKGRISAILSGAVVRSGMAAKGEEDAWEGYLKNAVNTFAPVESASRTIFSPFTDVKTNTTWYGTAIEGREFENKAIKDRYDETTSDLAIKLGKTKLMQDLNLSPKKIHYLIDQYTGVIGDVFLPWNTKGASDKNVLKSVVDVGEKNFTVDAVTSNKLSSKFYKIYDETTYQKSAGDENAALKLRYLNKVKEAVSDLYKEKDKVNASNKTDKEKLAENRIIQALINQTYQNAIDEKDIVSKAFTTTEGIGSEYSVVEVTKKNYKKLEEKQDNIGAYVITRNGLTTGKLYESQEKATKGLSDMIADYRYTEGIHLMHGAERALKYYNTATYEKAQKLNSAGVSYDDYYFAYMTAKQYAGDSEDKREFTIETIADLDLSREQTLLMIYAFGYSVKDGEFYGMTSKAAKTRMARYIKSLKISTEEKISLAKACGLTVKNGKIITK